MTRRRARSRHSLETTSDVSGTSAPRRGDERTRSVELELRSSSDGRATVAHTELAVDVGDVGLGRVQGDELCLGDLGVREVGREVLQDDALALGELLAPAGDVL